MGSPEALVCSSLQRKHLIWQPAIPQRLFILVIPMSDMRHTVNNRHACLSWDLLSCQLDLDILSLANFLHFEEIVPLRLRCSAWTPASAVSAQLYHFFRLPDPHITLTKLLIRASDMSQHIILNALLSGASLLLRVPSDISFITFYLTLFLFFCGASVPESFRCMTSSFIRTLDVCHVKA